MLTAPHVGEGKEAFPAIDPRETPFTALALAIQSGKVPVGANLPKDPLLALNQKPQIPASEMAVAQ